MDINNLKYVVGQAAENKPAVIRFFGAVDSYTTSCFNEEFLWLQNIVKPSKIIVLINSEGGSVVYGMSTFSVIQSCPIDVDCVVEGIAASMGSVIWAAGKNLFMHDYSLLMIHNPFSKCQDECDENTKAMVNAFRSQLKTIYCKRFGMKQEDVEKMMDGEENVDGTYIDAKDAVKRGIISKEHVLKTKAAVRNEISAKLEGVTDLAAIREIMATSTDEDLNKLTEKISAILEQNDIESSKNHNTMENNENPMFLAVAAQLGFSEDSQLATVSNRIAELIKAEGELKEVKSTLEALQIKFTGKETEVANLNEKLSEVEGQLKKYKDEEAAAHQAAIEALINQAITEGRIKEDVKAQWTKMANDDFETVKSTLESIPAREKITEAIAKDTENVEAAKSGQITAEQELQAKIQAVIGKDFEFKKLPE